MTVSVTLEDVSAVAGAKIILATISPPYGRTKLVQCGKRRHQEDSEIELLMPGGATEYRHVQKSGLALNRRAQPTIVYWFAPDHALEAKRLSCTFHVSAAFPVHLHDHLFSAPEYWQRTGSSIQKGSLARSYVLRIPCDEFELIYRFEKDVPFPRACPLVETRCADELGIAHEWRTIEFADDPTMQMDAAEWLGAQGTHVWRTNEPAVESLTFGAVPARDHGQAWKLVAKKPKVGLRFAFALTVDVAGSKIKQAEDLTEIGKNILDRVRHLKYTDTAIIDSFNEAMACELWLIAFDHMHGSDGDVSSPTTATPADCLKAMQAVSLRSYLWYGASHDNGIEPKGLWGCFGNSGIHNWGTRLEYGCGIAGHSFRFNKPITYSTAASTNRFEIRADDLYLSEREEKRDWLIGVPLRASEAGLPIGVLRLAARGLQSVHTDLTRTLHRLATEPERYEAQLNSLVWRLNLAFWKTVSDEKSGFEKPVITYAQKAFGLFPDASKLYSNRNSSVPPAVK